MLTYTFTKHEEKLTIFSTVFGSELPRIPSGYRLFSITKDKDDNRFSYPKPTHSLYLENSERQHFIQHNLK